MCAISVSELSGPHLQTTPPTLIPVGTVHSGDLPMARQEEDHETLSTKNEREEKRLSIMAMSKKRKRLYNQIMKTRSKKARQVEELRKRRKEYDEMQRTSRKKAKLS